MQEELLSFAIGAVAAKHGAEIEELFGVAVSAPAVPFPRIPLAEAREIVAARGYDIPRTDGDLDPEGERQISAHVKETLRARLRVHHGLPARDPRVLSHAG